MEHFTLEGRTFTVQRAAHEDLPALLALLRDDVLGSQRETADMGAYQRAFERIRSDPHQYLACVRDPEGKIVGTMQLSFIPGLSRGGTLRLQIEAVRVAETMRSKGLGRAMFAWAHDYGKREGATLVQLTTDKSRVTAHRFYRSLGYETTHEGFKLSL